VRPENVLVGRYISVCLGMLRACTWQMFASQVILLNNIVATCWETRVFGGLFLFLLDDCISALERESCIR
jgi:hypothetical protein